MKAYTYLENGKFELIEKSKPEIIESRDAIVRVTLSSICTSDHSGADVVLEVAGSKDTFSMAWECARPNAIVTVVALYDEAQSLPLPDMYGKNLIFKTGGVDGCSCKEILNLIAEGRIDTTPLITHTFSLNDIEKAYELFENRRDNVIKVAIKN